MPIRIIIHILRDTFQGKFLSLLISILLYLGLSPLVDQFVRFKFLLDILFSMILLSAIYAVSAKKHQTIIALALGIPMLVALWVDKFIVTDRLLIAAHLLAVPFFVYTIVRLLSFIFTESRVTRNVLFAAIIVYLLFGILWADLYQLMYSLQPGTFDIANIQTDNPNLVILYYSYVTLTTLGYGDITPLTDLSYSLAIMEAIIGQLYLTVLLARLVGLHISQSVGGGPKEPP